MAASGMGQPIRGARNDEFRRASAGAVPGPSSGAEFASICLSGQGGIEYTDSQRQTGNSCMTEAPDKLFIDARTLLLESIRLARRIWEDGFRPDYLIGVWRGGTPPGIVMHEYFRMQGHDPYHTTIKTQSYRGMQRGAGAVEIKGLEHVIDVVEATDRLLLIDDVFDTGHTMAAVLEEIRRRARLNAPECRVATVYYKPLRNETAIRPDYWQVESDEWIVFPHELEGLDEAEIRAKGSGIATAVLDTDEVSGS